MIRLAWRNLTQNPARLLISLGGVSVALVLMLTLDAIFTGMEQRVTAFIDRSGADIFVSQQDVRNMHMASSSLARGQQARVKSVAGVESVTPILYVTNPILAGKDRSLAYIIGVPSDAKAGGPWEIESGREDPGAGGVVLDVGVAAKAGIGLGGEVEILGDTFEVVGLSHGTASMAGSVAFISLDDFADLRQDSDTVSFLLVETAPGEAPEQVAAGIEARVRDVTAMTRQEFARQERKVVRDMSTDILAIMNIVGFLIGLAVMALTVYTGTLSRRAEYGVLKALGARNGKLAATVVWQAVISVSLGFLIALILTSLLTVAAPLASASLRLVIGLPSVAKVVVTSLVIAGVASLLPIWQMARLDPATVFRRR